MVGSLEGAFVRLPRPAALFQERAARFNALADTHTLAPTLRFLAALSGIQQRLAESLPVPAIPSIEELEGAYGYAQAPVERTRYDPDGAALAIADALILGLAEVPMPEPAEAALARLAAANAAERESALRGVLEEPAPDSAFAEHALLAAALQIGFAGMAAEMEAERLQPVAEGTACPVCGSPPLVSLMPDWQGARGTRYCVCGLCGTAWNYDRIKCTLCGSTEGIAYHRSNGDAGAIEAESCAACRRYVKILHQHKDPSLEPLADDVASLGLDLRMRETGFARGGIDPFLLGY